MIDGKVPTRYAFAYLSRLAHEPMSMWRAEQLGGLEHMGWGPETYLLAEQVDADQAMLAIKTHRGKGNVKFPDPVYRPKMRKGKVVEAPAPSQTLDDFDVKALLAQMGTG